MDFSRAEAQLTLVGSETLDSNLDMFIPEKGLVITTTYEFAKQNNLKSTITTANQKHKHNVNITIKDKNTTYQVATSRGNPCKQALLRSTAD